ncbi:hypothetical protein TgHK011_008360 [Trichoderma gracile]|nr:hypothetical protein TgHK011_008360 [Trichoderma gracile]
MPEDMKPVGRRFIFVLGAPGAGKGSLSKKLANRYCFTHISIGDLLRQVVAMPEANETVIGYVKRGELLPTELLFDVLRPHVDVGGTIILDGFPRRLDQAEAFEKEFQAPLLVLFFDCPRDLAEGRVVNRKQGREGDNLETFKKRYDEFQNLNPPLLERFEKQGKLITIDTSGYTKQSYATLLALLQGRL